MDKQKVLDVLNSFDVIESQGGDEGWVLVESSEDNLRTLEEVGIPREVALGYGDDETFCIAAVAFDLGVANCCENEKLSWRADLKG